MTTNSVSENHKQAAAFIHASTFLKYFFPLGNFFAPLLLWTFNKEKPFVDVHGKQAINFQLSMLIYTLLVGLLCLPFFIIFATDFISLIEAIENNYGNPTFQNIKNLSGFVVLFSIIVLLLFGLFVFELYCVISATMKAAKGESYNYPLSIPFLKPSATTTEEISS
jgi:uncharacterized Tic20 family protein